jgi:glycosyltransferase involved in cell wall biosynthesis
MNPQAVAVSVIICAYTEQRWAELLQAVESVNRQELEPDEIIRLSTTTTSA